MKIALTNPITGKTTRHRASLTTDHAACSYGQSILLVEGEPIDPANCVLQGAVIIEMPKRKSQWTMLDCWRKNAQAMLGG